MGSELSNIKAEDVKVHPLDVCHELSMWWGIKDVVCNVGGTIERYPKTKLPGHRYLKTFNAEGRYSATELDIIQLESINKSSFRLL